MSQISLRRCVYARGGQPQDIGRRRGSGPEEESLVVFIALKRSSIWLNRDVIFLATTDEEQSGEVSWKTLIAKYWDKFAAGYAINEGGKVVVKDGKVQHVAVQADEKVPVNVTVIAKGTAGHASIPTKDNPVAAPGRGQWPDSAIIRSGSPYLDHAALF